MDCYCFRLGSRFSLFIFLFLLLLFSPLPFSYLSPFLPNRLDQDPSQRVLVLVLGRFTPHASLRPAAPPISYTTHTLCKKKKAKTNRHPTNSLLTNRDHNPTQPRHHEKPSVPTPSSPASGSPVSTGTSSSNLIFLPPPPFPFLLLAAAAGAAFFFPLPLAGFAGEGEYMAPFPPEALRCWITWCVWMDEVGVIGSAYMGTWMSTSRSRPVVDR